MDEILDFVPGGPWLVGAVALLAIPGIRRNLRPLAKSAIRAGISVTDEVKKWTAEAREQANDLYEEAKAERVQALEDEANDTGSAGAVRPVGGRSSRRD